MLTVAAMKTKPCRYCNGTGKEVDQSALGSELRKKREASGISLRKMADSLGISPPFMSDLELGRRNWSPENIAKFNVVIRKGIAFQRVGAK